MSGEVDRGENALVMGERWEFGGSSDIQKLNVRRGGRAGRWWYIRLENWRRAFLLSFGSNDFVKSIHTKSCTVSTSLLSTFDLSDVRHERARRHTCLPRKTVAPGINEFETAGRASRK